MHQEIKKLVERQLQNCIIIEKATVIYTPVIVVSFKSSYSTGRNFKHGNGDRYGLAFLNAFTNKGKDKIVDALNSFPALGIIAIKEIIEENRLKQYIHGNTKAFLETKIGDEGQVYMHDLNDYSTVNFVNMSAGYRHWGK